MVEHEPSGIVLRFLAWIDQRQSDFGKVRSEAIRRVKAAFADDAIEGPRTTYFIVDTPLPQAGSGREEPLHRDAVDTSVNRDIDAQLQQAQREENADDLLTPTTQSGDAGAADTPGSN